MAELIRHVEICDRVHATFSDGSNRYFGDYNRVSVMVEVVVQLEGVHLDEPLMSRLPEGTTALTYRTKLEQMGVSSSDVESVFDKLVSSFLQNGADYLKRPVFAERLILKYSEKKPIIAPGGQSSLEISLVRR